MIPILPLVFVSMALLTGCGWLESSRSGCPSATEDARRQAPELGADRLMLSEGYSLLYRDASSLDRAELILYAKIESTKVDEIVTATSDWGRELKSGLERIGRDYPGVRIDLDPLPELEKRKRWAIGVDRARDFAPLIGRSGREYERTVLIGLLNGFNHERHLCRVMREVETDAGLNDFLEDAADHFDGLYDRVEGLLEAEYYKNPDGPTTN